MPSPTSSLTALPAPRIAAAPLRASPLARRIALRLVPALLIGLGLLLGLSVWIGRQAMQQEHERASLRMASLFEASLLNAMLKRDLEGLTRLVQHLGTLPGMAEALLTTPQGEVRFASEGVKRRDDRSAELQGLCLTAGCGAIAAPTLQWAGRGSEQRLRVVYPVRNQPACQGCHGAQAAYPVNGVLLLEFAPSEGERAALSLGSRGLLPGAVLVLLALGAWVAWVLRRDLLRPLARLHGAVQRFGAGEFGARSGMQGSDELARLGQGFDRMAAQIETQLRDLAGHGAFLQSLLDGAPDAMLLIGDDHRIVLANAAYARLVGRPLADIVGQSCHRVSRGRAEPCASTLVDCPLVALRRGGHAERTVMDFCRADGQRVDVEIDAAPVRSADGRWQAIEVIRPLQERVRFSQEQRLSAIGLLANGVAHEIHNPLASIRLALQSCLRGLTDGSLQRAELEHYLHLVDQQIDRCVHITQRLMRLSQPSAERALPVSVDAAVDDVFTLLSEEARRGGVRLDLALQRSGLRVLGDEGELRQVLVNVLQNAIHAMPEGGVATVRAEARDGVVTMRVQDRGIGIAADKLPLIFLPFYSRRAGGERGTGLGLAICKSLVEQRGGWIRAHSEPGRGSTIEWALPDADVPARMEAA